MTEEAKKPRRRRRTKAAVKAEQAIEAFQTTEEKIEEIVSEEVVEAVPEPEPIVETEPEPDTVSEVDTEVAELSRSKNQDPYDPSYGLTQTRFGRGKHLWRRRTRRQVVE